MRDTIIRPALAAMVLLPIAACAPKMSPQAAAIDSLAIAQQVIAAERYFAAQSERVGPLTALRATAAPGAMLFSPEPVPMEQVPAEVLDTPRGIHLNIHRVVLSCDATLAATTGTTRQADGQRSSYTTIWQVQGDGNWRWIADHAGEAGAALADVTTPAVEVAECPGAEGPDAHNDPAPGEARGGSRDSTLQWDWVDAGNMRGLRVTMWIGPRYVTTILPGTPPMSPQR